MYSLYRAWLMRDALSAASWTAPPDLIITVGNLGSECRGDIRGYGYQFVAHKQLVSMHSGYLKSLIQHESRTCETSLTNISLPNISSDSFAPLLSFMYTGYLDLTNENIYSVLLATHLLHMPRALDLCRAYLVQNQSNFNGSDDPRRSNSFRPSNVSTNLVKPIPSRKAQNSNQSIWSPISSGPVFLSTRPNGPFRSVPTAKAIEPPSPAAVPSTSKTNDSSPATIKRSSSFSAGTFNCDEIPDRAVKSPSKKAQKRREILKTSRKINNENLKAELDVACCDGPVRFQRVLNECYGMKLEQAGQSSAASKFEADEADEMAEKAYLENYPKTSFLKLKTSNFSNFMHRQVIKSNFFDKKHSKMTKGVIQMRKVISREISASSERDEDEDGEDDEKVHDDSEKSFTCIYCNHTFKSRYCYRKHAKRHINCVVDEEGEGEAAEYTSDPRSRGRSPARSKTHGERGEPGKVRRAVRLLDMNVQYYPCKTCGSKFPSYYFVHKHRKLCHANEDNFDENSNHRPENSDSSSAPPR